MSRSFWDGRYAEEGFAYGLEPSDFLVEHVKAIPHTAGGGRVLSLGEGEGRNAVYLARLGYHVHCVDISPVGLEKTLKLASSSQGLDSSLITTQCIDLKDFIQGGHSSGPWDAIINLWCHVPSSLRRTLHEWIGKDGSLVPGGVYILEHYHPSNIGRNTGGPQDPDLCLTLQDLETELASFYSSRASSGRPYAATLERQVHEGKYHNGLSAVTQFVGSKQQL